MATILDSPSRPLDMTINADLADRIDAMAAATERPRREIVEEALADWLDVDDLRHRRTLEGWPTSMPETSWTTSASSSG